MLQPLARRFAAFAERFMPDAFVFALGATFVAGIAAFLVDPAARADPTLVVLAWGGGFWELAKFTLQMSMIVVGGAVLASSPPVARAITGLAARPRTGPGAITLVALVAMLTSLLNWGFSLLVAAHLARSIAQRLRGVDYRALAAASLLGLGTVWAQGLSGSAALQMASASSLPAAVAKLTGAIPLTETIFRWQSGVAVVVEVAVVAIVVFLAAPRNGQDAAALGISLVDEAERPLPPPTTPGERWDHSPWLLRFVVVMAAAFAVLSLRAHGGSTSESLAAIDLNLVNLTLLFTGALLHGTPSRLARAVQDATPAVWGILLQFPFYAGISGIMTGTALSHHLADLFVGAASARWFPALVAAYSAVLGVFVPSGGSKWVIEAPYVLAAAARLGVPAGWVVVTYDLGEALANLVQPFWMLPVLSLLGLKARDVIGHTALVAVVLVPVVLVLVTVLAPG